MNKIQCPDALTIQAVADGEENDLIITDHLQNCSKCRETYLNVQKIISAAKGLNSTARLPIGFYKVLSGRIESKPFPAFLVAAIISALVFISVYLLNPTYLEWWFSVGMTRQFGFYIDMFFDLFFLSRSVNPLWVITVVTAMVVLEFLILSKLKTVEG